MTVFVLKIIAAVSMLIDHFGAAVFSPMRVTEADFAMYEMMRNVGRIAFPIFAYLIAQGCLHTKNINKYLLRLGLLALISEPFFDLAFIPDFGIDFLRFTNIFYTLFLGAAGIAIYEKTKRNEHQWPSALLAAAFYALYFSGNITSPHLTDSLFPVALVLVYLASAIILPNVLANSDNDSKQWQRHVIPIFAATPMLFVATFFTTDYAINGVAMILLIYAFGPQRPIGRAVALLISLYFLYPPMFGSTLNLSFFFSLVAVVLVALYNGKPGPNHPALKWGFYFFYPAHIAVLYLISLII